MDVSASTINNSVNAPVNSANAAANGMKGSDYVYTGNWFENTFNPAAANAIQNGLDKQFQIDYDSSKYQRAVKDLEAAGLNKWLAVQNGISSGSSAASTNDVNRSSNPGLNVVKSLVGTAAKVLGTLLFFGII